MAKLSKCWRQVLLVLACAGLGYVPTASAAVPALLTQQGRLLDEAGAPVDADVSFVFSIYSAATGGTALWTETQTITVDQGYFSARLGDVTAIDPALFDGTKNLFLGVKVGADPEMTPRQRVTSVPFAIRAQEADHAKAADTATTATNATTAATATNATNAAHATAADSATNATNATTAAAVTSIAANFSQATATGSATTSAVTAACPATYKAIAGGCRTNGAVMVSGFVKDQPTQFQCQCTASCTLTTQVVCAK
jgi:hypothetical protein